MSGHLGGVGSRSGILGQTEQGQYEVDSWRYTGTAAGNFSPISSSLERTDANAFTKIGAGMSHSSGIFSYPSTGLWAVSFEWYGYSTGNNRYIFANIMSSHNTGSDWFSMAVGKTQISDIGEYGHNSCFARGFISVTDISTFRTKFNIDVDASGTAVNTQGSSGENNTSMLFERLANI